MCADEQHPMRPETWGFGTGLVRGVFLALCVVAVIVPILLWQAARPMSLHEPAGPKPARPVAPTTQATGAEPTSQPVRPGPAEREAVAEARATLEPAAVAASAPVVERRRVQEGVSPPVGPSGRMVEDAGEGADEWDRSAEARRRAVERFGGTRETEDAVELGLAWLAAHQAADGMWDRVHFQRECPPGDVCSGAAVRRTEHTLRPGLTGLVLLAFLGAGYTDRAGPYQDVVRRGVNALVLFQQPNGGFAADDAMAGYNDAVATLALAEYFALTREERLVEPLGKAVRRLMGTQQELGGWDYLPVASSGRNDTSIAAWMVQALHACAAIGFEIPEETLVRAALHFVRATERDGQVRYSDAGTGFKLDENLRPVYRYGPGMVAAGLMAEQLLGWRLDGALPVRQRGLLLADPPSAERARGRDPSQLHSEYYWYYGTLAMFQRGGEDWERWNGRLRDAILPLQDRAMNEAGGRRHSYGSWAPFGENWGMWGRMGSRVYTTAICTLTLEVYYRHTPTFLTQEVIYGPAAWRRVLQHSGAREREVALAGLAQLRVEVAEPVLVELLGDPNRRVRLQVAQALGAMDSPLGVEVLEAEVSQLPPWEREPYERALARGRAVLALPAVRGKVRLYDAASGLATLELERSYIGMAVTVERVGEVVGRMEVIQRFTGREVVVARLVEAVAGLRPEAGDAVWSEGR